MGPVDHPAPERLSDWVHALCRVHGRRAPWRLPDGPDDVLLVDLADGYWTVRSRAQVRAIGVPPGYRPAIAVERFEWIDALDAGPSRPRTGASKPGDRPPPVGHAALPVSPGGDTPVRELIARPARGGHAPRDATHAGRRART